jgi:hypothetical protein
MLANPQVKSSASLKMVEYAVLIKTMPISRQMDTIVESIMFTATGSIEDLSS